MVQKRQCGKKGNMHAAALASAEECGRCMSQVIKS